MKISIRFRWLAAAAALLFAAHAAGQDLVITNGRVLDGTGRTIERGTVTVRDGRIASVVEGSAAATTGRVIDAAGRTVMPGLIDAHRHLIQGDGERWLAERAEQQLQEFLEAGFTTVLSAIDAPQILEARQRVQDGRMRGPRLFAAAFLPLAAPAPGAAPRPEGDPARFDASRTQRPTEPAPAIPREATVAAVERAAQAGYDYIKTVLIVTPGGPEVETLQLIVAEGARHGLPVITHAVSVQDTLAAVEARPAMLVHTPHIGHLGEAEDVRRIVDARIPMTSTLAVFVPHFGPDNRPLFRDGLPFPWETLSSAGQGPVNARLLWEAGLVYGFGTDTSWPPKESLLDELRALRLSFSPQDVVTIITRNAAIAAQKGDELGTLESGKLADIVIIEGDPLRSSEDLLNVVTTIKGGEVVYEQRR